MNAAPRKRDRRSKAEKALQADIDLKRKRMDNDGVSHEVSEEQSTSKRAKVKGHHDIKDMFAKKEIANAKSASEPSSSQTTMASSSSQGQSPSQDTIGSSDGKSASNKRKRGENGGSKSKGRSNDNTKPTDNEELEAIAQPVIPTQAQAMVNPESQIPSAPLPQPAIVESSSTPPPPSGSSSQSKRNNKKRKAAEKRQAESGETGEIGAAPSSAGTGSQAVTLPPVTVPSSVDQAKKKERAKKRAGIKRKKHEAKSPSAAVPGNAGNA